MPDQLLTPGSHPLSRRIADVLTVAPDERAIEFDGRWWSWREISSAAIGIADVVARHAAGPGPQVGILLRNTPIHIAALLGVLHSGGCVVTINPARGTDRVSTDLTALDLPLIIGDAEDLTAPAPLAPGVTVVAVSTESPDPWVSPASQPCHSGRRPGVAVRMLTSGTTGPPKRIDLTYDVLARSVMGPGESAAPSEIKRSVAIVTAPLVHIGGVFRTLQCVVDARPFVLLDRFELESWSDAVRRHRPRTVSLVPAALRAALHSGLTRDDLSSIRAVTSGTAPLSADDADAFTERFGIPVLTSYAATEFGGGVAGWTLADHQRFWTSKRGSVGRAILGAQLRVVDESGNPLAPGQPGLLEVISGQLGAETGWIRTTDLARIDSDGFLWILGRADQAIIRGGFKVLPDDVRSALESHPAVRAAAVVGRRDDRLGETPVAAVELRDGATIDADGLVNYLRTKLARYEVPTHIVIVDAIPRTPSGKPDLTAVHDLTASAQRV